MAGPHPIDKPASRRPASAAGTALRLCLLGVPRLELPGVAPHVLQRRDAALLALVVLGGPVQRARAAARVWPDADTEGARNNLRQRLFRLRRTAGFDLLGSEEVLVLAEGVEADLDMSDERLLGNPHDAEGDLLGNLDFGDCAELADWVDAERQRWRARRAAALADIAARLEEQRDIARALPYAQRLLRDDPLQEHAHRRVMRLHYLRGDRAAALEAYGRLVELLRHELRTAPGQETRELAQLVERGTPLPAGSRRPLPPAVLRPPRLVGRATEWSALHAAVADGLAVLLVGEAGLGKSRLLGDFAAQRGHATVAGARPGDTNLPYAVLARLLRALSESPPATPWVRAELARLLPEWGAPAPARLEALHLRAAVSRHMAELAALRPLTFVLDDLHFADAATLELLPALLADSAAVVWLLGTRPAGDAGTPLVELLAALAGIDRPRVQRIELQPLDHAAVHELLESLELPGLAAAVWADDLWRHSGGNPLFLLETLRAWLRSESGEVRLTAGLPAPAPLARLIEQRLERLSVPALRLARLAALAGSDFDIELAAAVLGVHALDLADPWGELEEAHIVRGAAFAHDLVLEATRVSVPPAIAQVLHGQIAAELARRGVAAARVAPHWQAARRWVEAARVHEAAARDALTASRRSEELAHRRAAIAAWDEADDAGEAFRARCESLEALLLIESVEQAQSLADTLLAQAGSAAQRLDAQLARAQTLLMAVRHGEAIEAATEARALALAAQDLGRERVAVRFIAVALAQAQRAAEAVALLEPYQAGLPDDPAGDDSFRYWSDFAYVLQAANQRSRCAQALERAIAGCERRGDFAEMLTNLNNLAALKNSLGRLAEAISDGERALALAERIGEVHGIPAGALQIHFGLVRAASGRPGTALRHFEAARTLFAGAGQATWVALAHIHVTNLLLQLGQTARAMQALPADDLTALQSIRARRCVVAARVEAALGRSPLTLLAQACELLGTRGDPTTRLQAQIDRLPWLDAAEALSQAQAIEPELADIEQLALVAKARWYHIQALQRHGGADAALPLVHEALAALSTVHPADMVLPEAWAIARSVLLAGGETRAAHEVLQQAIEWIDAATLDVPVDFRESFLHRNPVNRTLLAQRHML